MLYLVQLEKAVMADNWTALYMVEADTIDNAFSQVMELSNYQEGVSKLSASGMVGVSEPLLIGYSPPDSPVLPLRKQP